MEVVGSAKRKLSLSESSSQSPQAAPLRPSDGNEDAETTGFFTAYGKEDTSLSEVNSQLTTQSSFAPPETPSTVIVPSDEEKTIVTALDITDGDFEEEQKETDTVRQVRTII